MIARACHARLRFVEHGERGCEYVSRENEHRLLLLIHIDTSHVDMDRRISTWLFFLGTW